MFTVWMIDGVPNHIYFVNTDHFEQALTDRDIDPDFVKSQEITLERLIRLKERDYRVFILCLK